MSEPDFKRQSQGPALLCGPAKDTAQPNSVVCSRTPGWSLYTVLQSGVMDLFLSWLSPPRCRNLSPPLPFKREAPSEGCSVIWGQESETPELLDQILKRC